VAKFSVDWRLTKRYTVIVGIDRQADSQEGISDE